MSRVRFYDENIAQLLVAIGLHVSHDAVGRKRPEKVHDNEHVGKEECDVAASLRNLF